MASAGSVRSSLFLAQASDHSRTPHGPESHPYLVSYAGRQWLFCSAGDLSAELKEQLPLHEDFDIAPGRAQHRGARAALDHRRGAARRRAQHRRVLLAGIARALRTPERVWRSQLRDQRWCRPRGLPRRDGSQPAPLEPPRPAARDHPPGRPVLLGRLRFPDGWVANGRRRLVAADARCQLDPARAGRTARDPPREHRVEQPPDGHGREGLLRARPPSAAGAADAVDGERGADRSPGTPGAAAPRRAAAPRDAVGRARDHLPLPDSGRAQLPPLLPESGRGRSAGGACALARDLRRRHPARLRRRVRESLHAARGLPPLLGDVDRQPLHGAGGAGCCPRS